VGLERVQVRTDILDSLLTASGALKVVLSGRCGLSSGELYKGLTVR
jgi:hypothetical protein